MPGVAYLFKGHLEQHEADCWAVCDQAPVFASGQTADDALERLAEALTVYINQLVAASEVSRALAEGKLVEVDVSGDASQPAKHSNRLADGSFQTIIPQAA